MQYKIVTDKQSYIITEENNKIVIDTPSLKEFLLDLDECDAPYILMIEGEKNGNNV